MAGRQVDWATLTIWAMRADWIDILGSASSLGQTHARRLSTNPNATMARQVVQYKPPMPPDTLEIEVHVGVQRQAYRLAEWDVTIYGCYADTPAPMEICRIWSDTESQLHDRRCEGAELLYPTVILGLYQTMFANGPVESASK